jgi:hypothetical protein
MSPIIPATHNTAVRGAKMLLLGPTGVGKTSLLRTLLSTTTLFVNIEAGDLAVQDIAVNTVRPRTWPECRDLITWIAGANPAAPADAVYGEKHLDAVIDKFDNPEGPAKYHTIFIDSFTAAGRLCFGWSQQQPEAFSERSGKRDLRGAYGLHAREMCAWLLPRQIPGSTRRKIAPVGSIRLRSRISENSSPSSRGPAAISSISPQPPSKHKHRRS